WQNHQQSRQGH
ncbi:unnamed protein product, partial [Oikopleura dioica]